MSAIYAKLSRSMSIAAPDIGEKVHGLTKYLSPLQYSIEIEKHLDNHEVEAAYHYVQAQINEVSVDQTVHNLAAIAHTTYPIHLLQPRSKLTKYICPEHLLEEVTTALIRYYPQTSLSTQESVYLFLDQATARAGQYFGVTHFVRAPDALMPGKSLYVLILQDTLHKIQPKKLMYEGNRKSVAKARKNQGEPEWNRGLYNWSNHSKKSQSDKCWIFSAYYGDPQHPNVEEIRLLRDSLISDSYLGPAIKALNILYQKAGNTRGAAEFTRLLRADDSNFCRRLIGPLCLSLIGISRAYYKILENRDSRSRKVESKF